MEERQRKVRAVTPTERKRIEAQGFIGLSDDTIRGIANALRLAPAVCMAWTAVGTVASSPAILWSLVPFALLGSMLPVHPFDVIYQFGLRHVFGTPPLPPYPKPRRFACALASAVLTSAALSFSVGWNVAAYLLGGALVTAAATYVFTGFCVPSFLYGLLFGEAETCVPSTKALVSTRRQKVL